VGVLFENMKSFADGPLYTAYLLDGVASVVFRQGYRLTLLAEIDHNDVIGSLGDGQLDGVIWCKLARDEETVALIHKSPIPIVAFNAAAPEEGTDAIYVTCDNFGGLELAVDHLWKLGHRKIIFLYELDEVHTPDCVDRREAYQKAIAARGGDERVVECSWFLDGLVDQLRLSDCTAIICWTESLAGRLLDKLHAAHIDVPGKISVIGFDSTQFCETTSPRLTAIRQPIKEMAAFAAQALLNLISHEGSDSHSTVFPCTLDVRNSTTECPTV
jgi:LacI family transcriptional regulator